MEASTQPKSTAEKLLALRAKMEERARQEEQGRKDKLAAAEAEYEARARQANVNPSAGGPGLYSAPQSTGGLGTIPLPKSWFGAEQQAYVAQMPEDDIKALEERMNALCLAGEDGDIKQAAARLQALFRDKPGLSTLINPIIMHAYVEKMQSTRRMTYQSSMQRSASRAKSRDAKEAGNALMTLMGDSSVEI